MEAPYFRSTHLRQRRYVPALMAASSVAGLLLGNPLGNAACKALSNFSLYSDYSVLKNNVHNPQDTFEQSLHHVQEANDEKFFLLGIKSADTQKSGEVLQDVIDARLNATGETVRQLKPQLNMSVQHQFEFIVDKVQKYTSDLDLAHMHLKLYRAAFVSNETSM